MTEQLAETARQRALDIYRVVDSLPEAAYNDIAYLASVLCDTPIALVSLIDRDRQWFKASQGFSETGTRRDEAFCNHAIETPLDMMEVRDARDDSRFDSNPLVTGEHSIRFYAGMPLVTEAGAAIGTVCVLDKQPRELNETQRAGLQALARLTMSLLDARLHERELERMMLLAEAAPAEPVVSEPAPQRFTVAIFQVQDMAGAARLIGERVLERHLQDLNQRLHEALMSYPDHSVNRTSHSEEFIAVLHGDDTVEAFNSLCGHTAAFEASTGLRVLYGSAAANEPSERLEVVFLRADEALSQVKDAMAYGQSKAA